MLICTTLPLYTYALYVLYSCACHDVDIHDMVTPYLYTYHMHDMIALYFTKLVCTTSFLYTYASYIHFTLMHFTSLYIYLKCIHMIICFIYYALNYDEIWLGERPSYSPLTVAVIVWLLGTGWTLILGNRWLASEHRSELGGIHELNPLVATLLYYNLIVFWAFNPEYVIFVFSSL